jgi:glycosyltransferase involved in cell wall biosynthesis
MVSVCTPTFNRRPFVQAMLECFDHQTYPRERMEWIIIDDGTDPIEDLVASHPCVQYVRLDDKVSLGKKRNMMHKKARGDIIVYMDDDDYYPPERVAHAVERLRGSSAALAGCSNMLTVDYATDTMYQWATIHDRHSVSACMAWKRDYDGVYDVNERVSDEFVFTRGFRAPMIQLDPERTIVQTSHGGNTFLKELATSAGVVELADAIPLHVPLSYIERLRVTLS